MNVHMRPLEAFIHGSNPCAVAKLAFGMDV